MAIQILALDLSLNASGWAMGPASGDDRPQYGVLSPPKGWMGVVRLAHLRERIMPLARAASVVVIEEYAWFAKGRAGISLGELGGVIRLALHDAGIPWVAVNQTYVKQFATGKGNAKKNDMLAAAIRKLGYEGSSDDEADALWLLAMARMQYSGVGNKLQGKILNQIAWPHRETLKGDLRLS